MKLLKNNHVNMFVSVNAVLSTIYLLGLGYYNSYLLDDYGFIYRLSNEGLLSFIVDMYNTWQGRFGGFFLSGVLFKLFSTSNNLIGLTIIQLILGYVSYYLVFRWWLPVLSKSFLVLMSIILTNFSIIGIIVFSTFYWGCATAYISINFILILLIYFIFNTSVSKILSYLFIILLSILIGGFAEIYSPLVILVLGCIFLLKLFKTKISLFFGNEINIRLFFSLFVLSLSFLVQLLSPGNLVRLDFEAYHPTGLELIMKTFRAFIDLFFMLTPKLIYPLLLLPFFIYVGAVLKRNGFDFIPTLVFNSRFIFKSVVLLIVFLFIALMPGVYAIGEIPPPRSLSYMSMLILFLFFVLGVLYGNRYSNCFILGKFYLCFANIVLSIIMIMFISKEFPVAKSYNNEIQIRHEMLLDLNKTGFTGVANVKPIVVKAELSSYARFWNFVMTFYKPSKKINAFYFPYEIYTISTDKEEWRNVGLKNYLNLNFDVIGWDKPQFSSKK